MCIPDVTNQGIRTAGQSCSNNSDCQSNFCESTISVCIDVCGNDSDCSTGTSCHLRTVEALEDSSGEKRVTSARVCVDDSASELLLRK